MLISLIHFLTTYAKFFSMKKLSIFFPQYVYGFCTVFTEERNNKIWFYILDRNVCSVLYEKIVKY
jgi:hypothetical protein